ncbi:Cytochrome P450 18a1 like protein [Argiope bruennichi]|uniref:Cytochrome P450 18a1 like protein n=1 Tax=Argiope bruennichi TaxID=94029 RepID=A0A8T0FN40_ARGBR|nr:Cytochrome P450 18a1 like protein [Argiope bruennichi]
MDAITALILGALTLLISIWLLSNKNSKKHPPGPTGLPIVGYLPFLTKEPHKKLTELSKIYGPVYRVLLGSTNVIILTDFDLMKEAFWKDEFMGRPPDLPFELSKETIETGAFNDLPWKEQRRFTLHMLRDLGFGKTKMEQHMKEEIHELIDILVKNAGKSINLSDMLASSMSNNIAALIFGKRMEFNDPQRLKLNRVIQNVGRLAGAVSWHIYFPWLKKFFDTFNIGNKGKLVRTLMKMKNFCRKEIESHESTLDANNLRDFIDGFILEMQKKKNDPNTTFRKEVLVDISRLLFGAGSETVRVTLDWMLFTCVARPEIQKRIHAEIDEVIGRERFPTWEDHLRMPFTEAALTEIMRWKSIVPLNVMHYTLQDTELNGYFIPKHTHILSILWAVNFNEKLWGKDVNEYKPERFLSGDGKKVIKPEYTIAFSVGKRACPGKILAEIETFLYLVAILQKFELSVPPGRKISLEEKLGTTLFPPKQDLYLKLRQ